MSIFVVQNTAIRIARADWKLRGRGMRARRMADGICVNAIVWMLPIRRARDPDMMLEMAATRDVMKKVLPRVPSLMWNFSVKK